MLANPTKIVPVSRLTQPTVSSREVIDLLCNLSTFLMGTKDLEVGMALTIVSAIG